MKYISFITFYILFLSCTAPRKNFESYIPPPVPDYGQPSFWASLPDKHDSADAVPYLSELTDEQSQAKADVFYIHPTTYLRGKTWNAHSDDKTLKKITDEYPLREQASVFNGSCKVYAPYYRQATLFAFFDAKGNGQKALDLAYLDIKAAFEYYMKNYNHGRPVIIAGHSQGTWHAIRLLKEYFDEDAQLNKQLIVAYLIGGPVERNMFKSIEPSENEFQTGCYVAWHSMQWGKYFNPPTKKTKGAPGFDAYGKYDCINPLSWRRDTIHVSQVQNKGSVPYTFNRIDIKGADAKAVASGELWTHLPIHPGYIEMKEYHIFDYNLFYMNIRENVALRVEEYLRKKKN